MEYTGLDSVLIWLTDGKAKLIKDITAGIGTNGIFNANLLNAEGATAFNIQNLSPTSTAVYGSDSIAKHLVGTAAPTITVGANNLPPDVTAKLMGMSGDDSNGGYALKGHHPQVMGGAIGITHWNDNKAYICFPFGLWTQNGGIGLATNQQSVTAVHDNFQLAAQARPKDDLLMQLYIDNQKGFTEEKMLNYIIDGYTDSPASTDGQNQSSQGGQDNKQTDPAPASDPSKQKSDADKTVANN